MQCSKINTHSSKCMILLECLTDHLVPESSPTPSHSPKPRMRIIMLFCLWTTLRCVYISIGPSPTIDIICELPSDVYQLGRLRRLIFFSMDYVSIIIIFRQLSELFSLDSPHALTPIVLGCSSAYGMHECQFQYSLYHMQIYQHAYIYVKFNSHNHVM